MSEILNLVKGDIGNTFHDTSRNHVVAAADEVYDETLHDRQSTLNAMFAYKSEQASSSFSADCASSSQTLLGEVDFKAGTYVRNIGNIYASLKYGSNVSTVAIINPGEGVILPSDVNKVYSAVAGHCELVAYKDTALSELRNKVDKKCGKNLLDTSAATPGMCMSQTGIPIEDASETLTDYIPVSGNTFYFASCSNGTGSLSGVLMAAHYIAYYDSGFNLISTALRSSFTGNKKFKTPADCAYVRFGYYTSAEEPMVNEGEAREPYEEYSPVGGYVAGGSGDGVFDISVNNPNNGQPSQYANLEAALGTNGANVPENKRKGGMSVKFINSGTGKYEQWRYTGVATTGNPNPFVDTANWQGVDSTPTANSNNLVTSGGVASSLQDLDADIDEQLEDMNNTIDGVVESTEQRIGDLINTLADVFEKCVFTEDATSVLAPLFTINFADDAVKAICVANWDTDGNGQLSRQEAAAVTTLASNFSGNTNITSFNELKYFTGITALESYSAASHISRDFKGCTSLESIKLPSGLITLGQEAFQNCSSLKSITIPEGVTVIRNNTFYGCTSLTEVNVEGGLTEIGSSALRDTAIAWTEIPDTVTTLGDLAFCNCPNIRISYLPANIASSTKIFNGSGITDMELAEGYTTTDASSFEGCTGLTNIILPSTITSLGNRTFAGCTALGSVTIKATTPPTMGTQVLFSTNNTFKIYVPSASVDTYKAATGWSTYASRIEAITE